MFQGLRFASSGVLFVQFGGIGRVYQLVCSLVACVGVCGVCVSSVLYSLAACMGVRGCIGGLATSGIVQFCGACVVVADVWVGLLPVQPPRYCTVLLHAWVYRGVGYVVFFQYNYIRYCAVFAACVGVPGVRVSTSAWCHPALRWVGCMSSHPCL